MIKNLLIRRLECKRLLIKKLLVTGLIIGSFMVFSGCSDNGADENQTTNPNVQNSGSSNNNQTDNNGSTGDIEKPTGPNKFEAPQKEIYEVYEGYTIKKMYKKMTSDTSVNVRKGPDTTFDRIDIIEMNTVASVIGQCEDTGWYMVLCGSGVGFVSNIYFTKEVTEGPVILGEECPYYLYTKTEYNGQIGWFYKPEVGWQCENYEKVKQEIIDSGYSVEYFPVYIGAWRDSGNVMWIGYGKE